MTDSHATPDTSAGDTEPLRRTFFEYLTLVANQHGTRRRDQGWIWDSHEALILGMVGEPTVVPSLTLPDGIEPGAVKECFYNAFMLTLDHPHLTYVEGYAMAGFFPTVHAWAIDRTTGTIIDPTWVNLDYNGPFLYMGLPFSRKFLSQVLDESGGYPSVFESDWRRDAKALRCGLLFDREGLIDNWGDPPPF